MATGVIQDVVNCPQCGLPCSKETYYVEGEEALNCNWCGYHQLKTAQGTSSSKGYGSIHYVSKGSNEDNITVLKTPLSLTQKNEAVHKIIYECDRDKSGLYIWNDKEHRLERAIGYKPLTMDEHYDRLAEQKLIEDEYNRLCSTSCNSEEYEEF